MHLSIASRSHPAVTGKSNPYLCIQCNTLLSEAETTCNERGKRICPHGHRVTSVPIWWLPPLTTFCRLVVPVVLILLCVYHPAFVLPFDWPPLIRIFFGFAPAAILLVGLCSGGVFIARAAVYAYTGGPVKGLALSCLLAGGAALLSAGIILFLMPFVLAILVPD